MIDPKAVPTELMSRVLGITRRHLSALHADGVLEQSAKGKYDLVATVQAFLEYQKRGKVASEMGSARLGVEEEKLRKLRLDNDEREHRLLPAGDVEVAIVEGVRIMATHLDALPSRCASEFAGMTDAGRIRQRLKDEVRKIRGAIADRFTLLGAIHEGRDGSDAAAGPRARSVGRRKPGAAAGKRGARAVQVRADTVRDTAAEGVRESKA